MSPQAVAEQIIEQGNSPQLPLPDVVTPAVLHALLERVKQLKHTNADEALRVAKMGVAIAEQLEANDLLARALVLLGETLMQLYRHAETLEAYERANALFAQADNQLELTRLQVRMVITLFVLGRGDEALLLAEEAMVACYQLGAEAERDLARLEFGLGIIYMQMGRYDAALRAYGEAKGLLLRLGEVVEAARVDINRANIYQEMDELDSAENIYQMAREALDNFPDFREQVAVIDLNLAMLARRQGNYQQALTLLESAEKNGQTNRGLLSNAKLRRAFVYQHLGLFPEVVALAGQIEPDLRTEKMVEELAFALQLQGNGYRDAGNVQRSQVFYQEALERFEAVGNKLRTLEMLRELAIAGLESADLVASDSYTRQLLDYTGMTLPPALLGDAHLLRARYHLLNDDNRDAARRQIESAQELAAKYRLPETAAQAHALAAQIAPSFAAAWRAYRAAINGIELLRSRLWLDEFRLGFMDGKLPIYTDAIELLVRNGAPGELLLYLLDMAQSAPLAQGRLELSGSDSAELNELRQAWHWQQSKLEDETDPDSRRIIGTTVQRLEQQISELQRRTVKVTSPVDQRRELDAQTAQRTARRILRALPDGGLLLHFFIADGDVYACVVNKDGIETVQLAPAAKIGRTLQAWLHHLRDLQFIDSEASHQLAKRYLHMFDRLLLARIRSHLDRHAQLFVVLPPQWHNLPFAAFFDGGSYLIETHTLTFISAPSIMLESPLEAPRFRPNALVLGTSDNGTLPHSVAEAQQVGAALQQHWQCDLLLEADARSETIFERAKQLNLLHISTHAVFRPDNPAFSWMQLADKRLTMAELYHAHLTNNPLVVLSACETGLGRARGGGLAGMARALLTAGAAHLVVTLWRVESATAASLMQAFYNSLDGLQPRNVAAALRRAQLQQVHNRHPYFWAGYLFLQG